MATTTYTFTDPDGQKYEVDAPEGATSEQAFQVLQQHLGASSPSATPSPTSAGDYLRNYGKGINTAAAELNRTTRGPLELADAGLGAVTAGASWLPGGLDTLVGYVAPGLRDDDNPNNSYRKNASKYIYQPRSEGGAAALQGLGAVLKPIGDAAQFAGDKVGDGLQALGVSPEAAQQAREITPDALSYLAPAATKLGRAGVSKLLDANAAAVTKAAKVAAGAPILDNQITYAKNAKKLAEREFKSNGGDDIDIQGTRANPEKAQVQALGKWFIDNPEIGQAKDVAEKLKIVRAKREAAGADIGKNDALIEQVMQANGKTDLRLSGAYIIDRIKKSPEYKDLNEFEDIAAAGIGTGYDKMVSQMFKKNSLKERDFSYDDLGRMKKIIDDGIDWQNGDKTLNRQKKQFWHFLDDAQDELIGEADRHGGKAGRALADRLKENKYQYSMASKAEEGLQKQFFRKPGESITSVYRLLTGSGRKTAIAGGLLGGAAGATLAGVGGLGGGIPYAGAMGTMYGARAGRQLSDGKLRLLVTKSKHYKPGPL